MRQRYDGTAQRIVLYKSIPISSLNIFHVIVSFLVVLNKQLIGVFIKRKFFYVKTVTEKLSYRITKYPCWHLLLSS